MKILVKTMAALLVIGAYSSGGGMMATFAFMARRLC